VTPPHCGSHWSLSNKFKIYNDLDALLNYFMKFWDFLCTTPKMAIFFLTFQIAITYVTNIYFQIMAFTHYNNLQNLSNDVN
jgi:hypothetical protein